MFATIGYMVPEYFKFPGYLAPSASLKFADVPNGIQAITKVPAEGWLQWVALCGSNELCVNQPVDAADPGNYGKGKLGYGNMVLGITAESISDPEARKRGLNSELANGRLAMMAIMGLWVQDGLFGTPYGLYAGSSAFESELGVQAPVGFWDPLGFTAGGDAASFRRRRYVELKHGRVSMLACMGYIVPEYFRWPGDLSPSLGLKFSDVPTGFAAFSKVPLSGWAQMVAFAGSVELFQYTDDPKRAPGDFENAGFLGVPNGFLKAPAGSKEKKLAAEIANGRLAMMAIIGMFFQNGLTGSAWGDWALYTDSPLRALTPAQESIAGTGGPFPENYWDPAGITSKKSEEEILELRAIELKHGRVAMLAVLGWFHVAGGFHIIGDFATGTYLDNNPLVSVTQLPMGGMWQTVFFIMCLEWVSTYVCPPPKSKPWDILGWSDILLEDEDNYWNQFRKAEVQELNNGRLAMMAIVGLIVQDIFFGDFGEVKVCFSSQTCQDIGDYLPGWTGPLPPVAYDFPPLYPAPEVPYTGYQVLAEEPNTHVIIMSSLEQELLSEAIGSLPCWIIAEGGVCYREPDGTWLNMELQDKDWLAPAKEIMEYFAARTPGSRVIETTSSVSWHYQKTQGDHAAIQSKDLLIHLWAGPLLSAPAEVVVGNDEVSVRPTGVSKASQLEKILQRICCEEGTNSPTLQWQSDVSVTCICDLITKDEDVYLTLQKFFDQDGTKVTPAPMSRMMSGDDVSGRTGSLGTPLSVHEPMTDDWAGLDSSRQEVMNLEANSKSLGAFFNKRIAKNDDDAPPFGLHKPSSSSQGSNLASLSLEPHSIKKMPSEPELLASAPAAQALSTGKVSLITVTVSRKPTRAMYHVNDTTDVTFLIARLAREMRQMKQAHEHECTAAEESKAKDELQTAHGQA
ncbi:unnamed protein product [Effrenium voratum]|nr:unnamed protein product [Effrenium voratum]